MNPDVPLEWLNRSELLQILSREEYGYLRLRASVPKERLIHLISTKEPPSPDELAKTTETRQRLQSWIQKNWDQINSQLPCSGELRGKCTVYPCSEGRHLDCYLSAKKYMI